MALALEEMGFLRYSTTPNTMQLLEEQTPRIKPIDSIHLKTKDKITIVGHKFKSARYLMITGNKLLSPDCDKFNHNVSKSFSIMLFFSKLVICLNIFVINS